MNRIKEKINGIIKGRTCANGSKKKIYLKKGETVASTTVLIEVLLSTLMIDAYKVTDVDNFECLGAYLHTDMPKDFF